MSPSQPAGHTDAPAFDTIEVEETPEGPQTVEPLLRLRQLIPRQDAKQRLKTFTAFAQEGVQVLLKCEACAAEGRSWLLEPARAEESGELLLVCDCTLRILEGTA